MGAQEAIYPDGTMSTFSEGGGSFHEGMGIQRLRLITARQCLSTYIKFDGKMELTRNGHKLAVVNVIEPLSGKKFTSPTGRLSFAGCRKALAECERLIADLEDSAVVWTEE